MTPQTPVVLTKRTSGSISDGMCLLWRLADEDLRSAMSRHQHRLNAIRAALSQMIARGQLSQEGYDLAMENAWAKYDEDMKEAYERFDAVCDVVWPEERAGRLSQSLPEWYGGLKGPRG